MAKRIIIALIVIMAMFSMQGCNKTWSVVFDSQASLNGWELQDYITPYETYISQDGLYLNGDFAHAPFGFEGDFTIEVSFDLHVEFDDLPQLQFVLADGVDAPFTEFISSFFLNLGSSAEGYQVDEQDPYHSLGGGLLVDGLNRNGSNIYKLVKTGNHIIIYMNGSIICENDLTSYTSTKFFPSIFIYADSQSQIAIKSIKVVYDGDTTVHPRP